MKHIRIFESFNDEFQLDEEFGFDDINEGYDIKDVLGSVILGPLYDMKKMHDVSKDLWNTNPVLSKIKDTLVKKGAVSVSSAAPKIASGVAGGSKAAATKLTKKATGKGLDTKIIESILENVKDRNEALMTIRNYVSAQLKLSMINKKTKKEVSYNQWEKEMMDLKKEREAQAKKEASHKGKY